MDGTLTLVGRRQEREELAAVAAAARDGRARALVLHGPPGAGKTALLEDLAGSAGDLQLLRATGVEMERAMPFAGLDALLRPVLAHRAALPDPQVAALEGALALASGRTVTQLAVGAATISLLAAAADERPVLCLVDDAQWLDEPTLTALGFAARRLEREAVGLVLAVRGDEQPDVHLGGLARLRLAPLPVPDAGDLLARLSDGRLPPATAAQLLAAAAGNPLALLELAGRLTPAQLAGREELVGPPPPTASARELLADRVGRLGPAARAALLVVAAAGDEDVDVLRLALRAAGRTLGDLAPAEQEGLVALASGRLLLRHPLVRSVAYHGAAPDERRAAHGAVAAGLEEGDVRRAWHLAAATVGPSESVAAALERAASVARARGGPGPAGRLQRRAADLTADRERRARRLLAAAADFEPAGVPDEARRALDDAEELADDPVLLARIRGSRGQVLLRSGQPAAARGPLVRQAAELAGHDDTAAARLLLDAALASMLLGELDSWREHARSALGLLPGPEEPLRDVAAAMLATALIGAGRAPEAEPLLEEIRFGERAASGAALAGTVDVLALLAHALVWIDRWPEAERLIDRLVDGARTSTAVSALGYALGVRAALDARRGRWAAASAGAEEGIALAAATGSESHVAGTSGVAALLAAWQGRGEDCEAYAQRSLTLAERSAPRLVVWPEYALGERALARGEIETAAAHLGRAAAVHDAAGLLEPGSRPWQPSLIEALVRLGELRRAEELLGAWDRDAQATGRGFARATAARCRGLLCDEASLDEVFAAALAAHAEPDMPFERARTLLCHGERLRRARRHADARRPLRDALAIFDRLGAADWAARTRQELRATGTTAPSAARPELAELTPHEVQIALMVAEGRTNREVAAAMFLAPKTVEHHLTTIFRKLGLRRRTELARLFAGELAGRAGPPEPAAAARAGARAG